MIKFFLLSLYSAYHSSQSMVLALVIALSMCLFYYLGRLIWRSKYHILIRLSLIFVGAGLIGGGSYISIVWVADYKAKQQIQKIFPVEDMERLKAAYCTSKEINIEKVTTEIINRLQNCAASDFDKQNIDELINIDSILENPFIVNKCDISYPMRIRALIVETLEKNRKNCPENLRTLHQYEKSHQIEREIANDSAKTESWKILIENGARAYFQFWEQLSKTKEGRTKIKNSAYLCNAAMQELDIYIDDQDEFERLAMNLLLKLPQRMAQKFSDMDVQQYIKKHFSSLVCTIEGRKKIIQDIQRLTKVAIIQTEALCDLIETGSSADLKRLIENRASSETNKIIQEIGNVYK